VTRRTIDLTDDNWRFGQVPRCSFIARNVYDLHAATEWLPATVPGNVRTDLLALGHIPDPFFAEGYKESLWVEEVDWWYRRQLQIDTLAPDQRAFLVFEGIDYLSAIFVNGQEMARHEGMFSRQVVEITETLRQTGDVELAVRLWGSGALPQRHLSWLQRGWQKIAQVLHGSWTGVYPDRSATLKCQMSFGWDFAPPIRTMGIWDEIYLVISGPVFIAEVNAIGQLSFATQAPAEIVGRGAAEQRSRGNKKSSPAPLLPFPPTPATISIHLSLDADRPRQVKATVRIRPANFEGTTAGPFHFLLDLSAGRTDQRLEIQLPDAALWQPWDRGQPNLYDVDIKLTEGDGEPLDTIFLRTGIRAVNLESWQFSSNGQREFIRGLNWVPADSFPGRLRRDDYAKLLHLARQSGANLLRVWGGGLREKRAFYDLCDELGLMIWQEFPFACMFLGTYPRNQAYLLQVEVECRAIVRQICHHPAVVVWCGGNEFSHWRNRPLINALTDVVHQEDGTRPFIPVSPSFDEGADTHNWHVWHGEAPIQDYQRENARFLSEFGLQALPHLDTLKAALPDPAHDWETHNADRHKLKRYASLFKRQVADNNEFNRMTEPYLSGPKSQSPNSHLQSLILTSQRAQAVALQTAVEHLRRRKGEAGGLCLWQFNEPWPAISWAIVDYFGRPKLAYQGLSAWYNPVLVSLKFPVGRCWQTGEIFAAEIWAINDLNEAYVGCKLQVKIDENIVHTQSLDLPADSAQCAGEVAHRLTISPGKIRLILFHRNEPLAENSYDLDWFDESRGSLYLWLRRWLAQWAMR
jgi:beta-mannosidase